MFVVPDAAPSRITRAEWQWCTCSWSSPVGSQDTHHPPVGCRPDAAQCTRSLKRRLHHVNLPVMSTYKALFENGSCCTPTAGGLRSASAYARGLTTDLSAFASVSHPSALKRRRVCQGVATVPDVCTSLFALPHGRPSPLCVACGAAGTRPAWQSTELSPAVPAR